MERIFDRKSDNFTDIGTAGKWECIRTRASAEAVGNENVGQVRGDSNPGPTTSPPWSSTAYLDHQANDMSGSIAEWVAASRRRVAAVSGATEVAAR